jgi:hypothetical protein
MSWLLPLLVARALIPVGFMLMPDGDGLRLVLCSGSGPVPVFQAAAHDASAHSRALTEQATPHQPGDPAQFAQAHAAHLDDAQFGAHSSEAPDHSHTGRAAHDNAVCPFAFAASPCAGSSTVSIAAIAPLSAANTPSAYSDPLLESGPVRVECIRGPPVCA